MTLVIAAKGKDFLVLGTDSRGTMRDVDGNTVQLNTMVKLIPISKYVGILVYGAAGPAFYILDEFKIMLEGEDLDVLEITKKLANMCREEARKVHDVPATHFPDFGFVIAGLDKEGRKYVPKCYNLTAASGFRISTYHQGFAIEGIPFIATYLFAKNYEKTNMNDETDLATLVAQAFHDTMNIDGDVGGKVRMAIIDQTGLREVQYEDFEIESWNM
jgi:20S proteasome alpha/beta subunit